MREWIQVSSDFSGYLLILENEFIASFFNDSLFIYRFQFFHSSSPPVLNVNENFLDLQTVIFEEISAELHRLRDDSHHYIRALVYTVLIRINRIYIEEYGFSKQLFQDDTALRFRKLLEEHIRKKQRVQDYATLLKLSRSRLNHVIQNALGKSVSDVIRERLLLEVERALLYSDHSISEIAYELGFSDTSNFTRFCKRYMGCTPVTFRTSRKK